METFWYVAITVMLAVYVVLDGFDFGVGILSPFVARNERDRHLTLMSIKPVWKGYEVWLIVSVGVLFFAFPRAYAAGFSGFYLELIIVLWLLIFRGLSLELRSHVDHPMWRQLWDSVFAGASFLLAFVFGTALGNLIRGVPLNPDGYFFVALWTDFTPGPKPGILDWYTILMGAASVAILTLHGANYLTMKTEGEIFRRADGLGRLMGWVVVLLTIVAFLAIPVARPSFRNNFDANPVGYVFPAIGLLALAATLWLRRQQHDLPAFAASSLFILVMLGSTAWGCYPDLLTATTDPANSLTIFNATAGAYGLRAGLVWFLLGISLVIAYSVIVHLAFRGKVRLEPGTPTNSS